MKNHIANLKKEGIVTLPYPAGLRQDVNETFEAWKRFCDLPAEVKSNLPYSNNADGVGYELKNGVGKNADRKENFDVTTAGEDWLLQNAEAVKNPVALEFIRNATTLATVMRPTILRFARECEEAFNLTDFAREVEEGDGAFFVRFIHYFGDRTPGEETASAHVDQSGFTLHLFESAPGLQCFSYDKKWLDMPVSGGETVIIPAMQMQLRSKGDLIALCHRVIANTETAESGRYSAVCFVQLQNTPKYDKEKSGRLQEKLPGFNYSMGHEEFRTLFRG